MLKTGTAQSVQQHHVIPRKTTDTRLASRDGSLIGANLFRAPEDTFMICRAEWKSGSDSDEGLMADTAYILEAFRNGENVSPTWMKRKVRYEKDQ